MKKLSIYAQAHRLKKNPEPLVEPHEKGAYVATFAERRALYAHAAQLRKVQAAAGQQPTQVETASQTAVSKPPQASTSSVSASIPPKSQPTAPGAAVPVNAIAPASAPACDRVQPRYADSPPFSTAATVESSNALAKARATKGAGFQLRVHSAEVWNALAGMHSLQNGCDQATALKDLGFVHPAISVAISRR